MARMWSTLVWVALASACADLDVTGKACNQSHPCPGGLVCVGHDAEGIGRCTPPPERCDVDGDCPLDHFCNPLSQCDPGCRCQFDDCASSGFDAGTFVCNADCSTDTSGCYDCTAEQELCAGECRFVLSDPLHCNGCNDDCDAGQLCVAGACASASVDWVAAGAEVGTQITTHAVTATKTGPLLAFVDQSTTDFDHLRSVAWTGSDWGAAEQISLVPASIPAVAVYVDGTRPVAAYILDGASGTDRRLAEFVDGFWRSFGEPYATACVFIEHVDYVVVGNRHQVLTIGAGGCGYGVEHAWWDGLAWQFHPDGAFVHGGLTDSAAGLPAVAARGGRALFAIAEQDNAAGHNLHRVRWFDDGWHDLGGRLDVTDDSVPGFEEDMALAVSWRGEVYVAWTEELSAGAGTERSIFVRRYDDASASWQSLGAAVATTTEELRLTSLVLVGPSPWIAYTTGSPSIARVQRYDGSGWLQVGGDLNADAGVSVDRPLLVYAAGKPWVAFREGNNAEQTLRVSTLP